MKAAFACRTNAFLSAKNKTLVTYPPRLNTSVKDAATLVFPVPAHVKTMT